MNISFTVYGKPEPQGSMRAFVIKGRPIVTSSNKNLKSWRQQVATAALVARDDVQGPSAAIWEGAVNVMVNFYFDKPKSVKRTYMTTRPDLDKLVRSVNDALTGIIFKDDSQVVACAAFKFYGSPARAEIQVEEIA